MVLLWVDIVLSGRRVAMYQGNVLPPSSESFTLRVECIAPITRLHCVIKQKTTILVTFELVVIWIHDFQILLRESASCLV
jgi:hypothetical protein